MPTDPAVDDYRALTEDGIRESMEAYKRHTDLRFSRTLSVDTLLKLMNNGYGFRVTDSDLRLFYQYLQKICSDSNSGFELERQSGDSERPTAFRVKS